MDLRLVAIPFRNSLSSSDYGLDNPGTWGAKMSQIANTIAAAGYGWSVAQTGYYNQSTSYFVIEHTSGAQIMAIAMFYNNAQCIDASNDDTGSGANAGNLRLAFGSSGLSTQIPTITDSLNPYDTVDFCETYGLHKFRIVDFDNVTTAFNAYVRMYWVFDLDSAYVQYTNFTGSAYGFRNCVWFVDETTEPWLALADPSDSGGPIVMYSLNTNEGIWPPTWGLRIHPDGDLWAYENYDDYYFTRRTSAWDREMVLGQYASEYWAKLVDWWEEPISLFEITHPTNGRKGILKPEIACECRIDIGCGRRFQFEGELGYDMIQGDRRGGLLYPWPKGEPWIL